MKKLVVMVMTFSIVFTSLGSPRLIYAKENKTQQEVENYINSKAEEKTGDGISKEPKIDSGEESQSDDGKLGENDTDNIAGKEDSDNNVSDEENGSEENKDNQGEQIRTESEQSNFTQAGEDAPSGLKINLLSNPYGVTRNALSFSWMDSSLNGMQTQSAYRIVISKRQENVQSETYLYDTNWVQSKQNTSILYDLSDELEENELYYWQVQIRNVDGTESSLSEPQAFTTEVGNKWTSTKGIWGTTNQNMVMLRSELENDENIEKAIISVTASSAKKTRQYVYNLYINGQEVGVGPVRQDGKELYYNTYDITNYMTDNKNVIGIINYSEENPAFLCQITYYMKDGSQKVVMNSEKNKNQWKVLDANDIYVGSDTTSIGTWAYYAKRDNLNATKYPYGWEKTGFNTKNWKAVTTNSNFDKYTLTSSQMDNMKRYKVTPQSITKTSANTYFIDFGKEIIGGIQLDLKCSARNITIEYGEELNEDGSVRSQLATGNLYKETWTLKSGSQTLFGIGMKTFRYVTIKNLPDGFGKKNITGLMLRQEFNAESSDFQSSNKILNDVYSMCKYTSKATTQDLYVDSQNRERVPYEGDALITALTSYCFSASSTSANATAEYLLNNTTWPAEYSILNISLIYQNYMYTGDHRNLEKAYKLLKNKTLEKYFDESIGLMKNVGEGEDDSQEIMVDWPVTERDGYKVNEVEYNTVFNAVCVGGYRTCF